ncbi:M15 family metallopeptidase [Nocardiopsis ganjiahuensis]|uniref:M15 family metallopeptidase n=1 Tax=Nocardiopsis ganjiahuensis TaxID=239984 RepID=UPI000368B39F|nr:M15 family metallopeptidase [Nocardiopsis ganjiahuensis]
MSTALLFALTCAAPGTAVVTPQEVSEAPEQGDLDVLRVELAAARAEVSALREDAAERIRDYEEESARLEELTGEREAADSRAEAAGRRHEESRLGAARQAANAYKGGDLSLMQAWVGPEGPAGALERGAYLTLFGEHRSADLARAKASQVATDALAEAAESAEQEQAEAAEAADTAREAALEAIAVQEERAEELLGRQTLLEEALAESRDPEREEERREETLVDARAAVTQQAGTAQAGAVPAAEVTLSGGEAADGEPDADTESGCTDSGTGGFENGRIPDTVLCPLPQPGEQLRADAAAAFIELDGAFRSEFNRPMCVADSYRPYHEQVRLFQEMLPGMAARPGTSAHGLGIAVDLCGGVNELGTAEHRWMLDNGPDHGWDNPDWARGGFEPWHWEFAP